MCLQDPSEYITFLPLSKSFNHQSPAHWKLVAEAIGEWLRDIVVDQVCPERTWGTDLYWMALIAVYPNPDKVPWTEWDTQIHVKNSFAEKWLFEPGTYVSHDDGCEDGCAASSSKRT